MALPDRLQITAGSPSPLGASWDGRGVNLALPAGRAERVEWCLFETPDAPREALALTLPGRTGDVRHGYLEGIGPGTAYGLRVHGPWDPARGQLYNPAKLLLDPWARALAGTLRWDDLLLAHVPGTPADGERQPDPRDSAPCMPRALVVDERFDWRGDTPPATSLRDSVIYECQVRGLSARHPELAPELRGTYLGAASPPIIAHLQSLGVTALELLPIHAHVSERQLVERGLSNAWGYNTLGFCAPDARFSSDPSGRSGAQVNEFKQMVRQLHAAGIEVILDVVYNHTPEGNQDGPCLSWRGLDNPGFYQLSASDPRYNVDHTGCGNSLRTTSGPGLALMLDSLRHWVTDMHVDGFRFDLAPALGRPGPLAEVGFEVFQQLRDDPQLAHVKLIAEPWDVGPGGFRLGSFPAGWSEWNSHFRDDLRAFWKGDSGKRAIMATRLAGSTSELGHGPTHSLNLLCCHDGYTLRDLVSYEERHNQANGEDNSDGHAHNLSCNWGAEGPTDDAGVRDVRGRVARSLAATARLALGVPMLLMGDELWRTQQGNNNAYCQDGPEFHLDWELDDDAAAMLAFSRRLARLTAELPSLRRDHGLTGNSHDGEDGQLDVTWLGQRGHPVSERAWKKQDVHVLGMLLAGAPAAGQVLLWLNGGSESRRCQLPPTAPGRWRVLLDCADPGAEEYDLASAEAAVTVRDRALLVLRWRAD
ncbi:MAG: glycogen debranching enzyme GlgX [Planctomycetota bacterium]|nr:MAG: glycogen debranching enzyme GlgX [Planctomycetota bacterium]